MGIYCKITEYVRQLNLEIKRVNELQARQAAEAQLQAESAKKEETPAPPSPQVSSEPPATTGADPATTGADPATTGADPAGNLQTNKDVVTPQTEGEGAINLDILTFSAFNNLN